MPVNPCNGCRNDLAGVKGRICGLMMSRDPDCILYVPRPGFEAEKARREEARPAPRWRSVGGLLVPATEPV